jgi:hypothetical protein
MEEQMDDYITRELARARKELELAQRIHRYNLDNGDGTESARLVRHWLTRVDQLELQLLCADTSLDWRELDTIRVR